MNRDFKGVWIPKEIWLDDNLTWIEKLFLTEINSLDNEDGCFASNNYFAKFFKLTAGRCSQIINKLIEKVYLSAEYEKSGKQTTKRVLRILNRGIKYSKGGIKKIKQGYLENAQDINTNINNTGNNTKRHSTVPAPQDKDIEFKRKIYASFDALQKIADPVKTRSIIKDMVKKRMFEAVATSHNITRDEAAELMLKLFLKLTNEKRKFPFKDSSVLTVTRFRSCFEAIQAEISEYIRVTESDKYFENELREMGGVF